MLELALRRLSDLQLFSLREEWECKASKLLSKRRALRRFTQSEIKLIANQWAQECRLSDDAYKNLFSKKSQSSKSACIVKTPIGAKLKCAFGTSHET